MNPQADQASHQAATPPLFQAIGTLPGRLALDEQGRYRLDTSDGASFPVYVRGRMYQRILGSPDLLGQVLPWSVYPKTDQLGNLTYFQLIRFGDQKTRPAGEFHVSGRVVPAHREGLIGVRIQSNLPSNPPPQPGKLAMPGQRFSPFYINLHGFLPGDSLGEVWRFVCLREGVHLEMVDAVKVRDRRAKSKPSKKRQGAKTKSPQPQ